MTIPLYTQTISVAGQPLIKGNATLLAGSNVTLTQTGKQITIAATGGGGGGAVDSVNGQTGVVVLAKSDIGLGNVDNTSDANKPISTATQTALDGKVDENVAITGATKTKITYDAKGLITGGLDATTADINDSTNRRYITDAQLIVVGNTSGTNTGDQTNISGNAGTVTTINGKLSAGTNVTIDGLGTTASPYVINASGGGSDAFFDGGASATTYSPSNRNLNGGGA